MQSSSKFDIIVYGATGFTGQLVAEYLATQYRDDKQLKWAMAGRSLDKLTSIRDAIGASADTALIVADAGDVDSMKAMIAQTKSVISTVGPYQLYGSELIAACAASGTDYIDLCGEPVWMRQMSMKGTFSGGTYASIKATFTAATKDLSLVALLKNPFALTPGFEGPKQPPGNKPLFDEELQSWTAPFVMSTINTRSIHRSNMLMGFPYGRDFIYDEMVLTGPGEQGQANAKLVMAANNKMSGHEAPKPGEGPSKEERETGSYDLLFVALAPDGRQVHIAVKGDRDPGYGATAKMIAECAICLLRDTREVRAGIWTPGAAMGDRLIKRLAAHAGMTFQVESQVETQVGTQVQA